ncbi:MAG: hypothetical protein HC777_03265 [Hyphomonadaceae bacterium]|nr:hypothetical protein [Hyphomonadaceae bacterium]
MIFAIPESIFSILQVVFNLKNSDFSWILLSALLRGRHDPSCPSSGLSKTGRGQEIMSELSVSAQAKQRIEAVLDRGRNGMNWQARRFVPSNLKPKGLARLEEIGDTANRIIRPKIASLRAKANGGSGLSLLQVGNIAMYGLLNALVLEKAKCKLT